MRSIIQAKCDRIEKLTHEINKFKNEIEELKEEIEKLNNVELQEDILLSTTQAATLLGINPRTLRQWRSTKRRSLPFIKEEGKRRYFIKYYLSEVKRFIKENKGTIYVTQVRNVR